MKDFIVVNYLSKEACTFCIHPSTFVIKNFGVTLASNVKEGDKLLTHDGTFKKVVKVFKRYYEGPIYKIKTHYYPDYAMLTIEHPILALKRGEKKPKWYLPFQLEKGDYTLFPIIKQEKKIKISDYVDIPHLVKEEKGIKKDDNFVYIPIYKIEKEFYSGEVFNYETENGTYVINNFIVHNCIVFTQAIKLSGADIDIIEYGSGDPRIEVLEKFLGRKLLPEECPSGIIQGHFVNASRDFVFMYHLLKGLKPKYLSWKEEI